MTVGERVARALYTLAWYLGLPIAMAYLLWRSLRQPEYRRHWAERFLGHGAAPPAGQHETLWIHAVSVGETRAAQPLIEALAAARPAARIVLTHMTPTGRAVGEGLARSLSGRLIQRYLPYDLPSALRRFFAEVRPAIGIVLETEAWPNLLFTAADLRVPMLLVNARLSPRSLARGRRFAALLRPAVRAFARIAAQTEADRLRLAQMYAGPIEVVGNLKFDLAPDPAQRERGALLRAAWPAKCVWLLATTREGEEDMLLEALARRFDLRVADAPALVIVPRHPQRFDEVARAIAARGFAVQRRSQAGDAAAPSAGTVLLGDTMGEMTLYYSAADVAFIGGSLQPLGGHNLIEAAACGCPVVIGPHTFNFAQATADAVAAGAAVQVRDAEGVVAALLEISANAARREAMRAAALGFAAAHRGATARTVALISGLLAGEARERAASDPRDAARR